MNHFRLAFLSLSLFLSIAATPQSILDSIQKPYIEKTITYLASDKLKGRVNYSKEQLQAADFLSNEFAAFGLSPFPGINNYFVPFRTRIAARKTIGQLKWNGEKLADSLYYFLPQSLYTDKLTLDDFIVLEVSGLPPAAIVAQQWENKQRTLLWIKPSDTLSIGEMLQQINLPAGMPTADILIVIHPDAPVSMSFAGISANMESALYNVVGMLPGKSKPDEVVIFSAHYDHVDHGVDGLSGLVFNGANDNASGTTAVLALAKYFALRNDNERTILFCLFAGEELGMLGSSAFVNMVNPQMVKAMINIEMIGATNATGKNAFMLTGPGYSTLYDIMRKNLKGTKFKTKALSYDPTNLFMRSDNYPFHTAGIVAHTVMCSDDKEPCYHKPCDDVKNLDLDNMVNIIKSIALSCRTIITGEDTPAPYGKN